MPALCCDHSITFLSWRKGLTVGPRSSWQSSVMGVSAQHTAVLWRRILR